MLIVVKITAIVVDEASFGTVREKATGFYIRIQTLTHAIHQNKTKQTRFCELIFANKQVKNLKL